MARNPRKLSENGIYHIMFRGSNKQELFLDNRDYEKLLIILAQLKEELSFEVLAYCLMTNHVHFVLKENTLGDISVIMHRLLTKYARWFNIKYDRTGTLLEGRYRSQVVNDDEYFLHLIRYVHQNPLKANMVEALADYRWSSYSNYIKGENQLTDTKLLTEMLSLTQFKEFHAEIEEKEFSLFDNSKLADYEFLNLLRQLEIASIDELKALMLVNPNKFYDIIEILKREYSDRHIARITGISRYKLNRK